MSSGRPALPLRLFTSTLLAVVLGGPAGAQEPGSQPAPPPNPCEAPEVAQFDFWVGEWDLTWQGGHGTNRIERILDGCAVQESFEGDMGQGGPLFRGRSLSIWDAARGVWRQTWVDNQGSFFVFEGGMVGEEMILGMERERDGKTIRMRMVFRNIAADSLDWDWQRYDDETAAWTTAWAIHYERRR